MPQARGCAGRDAGGRGGRPRQGGAPLAAEASARPAGARPHNLLGSKFWFSAGGNSNYDIVIKFLLGGSPRLPSGFASFQAYDDERVLVHYRNCVSFVPQIGDAVQAESVERRARDGKLQAFTARPGTFGNTYIPL